MKFISSLTFISITNVLIEQNKVHYNIFTCVCVLSLILKMVLSVGWLALLFETGAHIIALMDLKVIM